MNTSPRQLGKYELQSPLGRGGMAEVWKAFDTRLQRYVAIKLLHANLQNDPDFMKRFEREARVVAALHHNNIVRIHDFQLSHTPDSESLIAYMVMEYIEGQTLTGFIHNTSYLGKFPSASDIVHLFVSISSAIDYAHQRGLIHRDIKPSNILLDQRNRSPSQMGEPILTDFGIVKLLGSSTGTLSGGWLGTPAYISPEQAQGHTGNEQSDIYALGVTLYEICTGVLPFQGDNPVSIIMQHMSATPTPPELINPKIPPALSTVILRSLAKDPTARFPTASMMAIALSEAFNMPVPAHLHQPSHLLNIGSEPTSTYKHQLQVNSPLTPPAYTTPINEARDPLYMAAPPTPQFTVSPASPLEPNTPDLKISHIITPVPVKIPSPITPETPILKGKRRHALAVLIAVILLVLASSGLGTFYWQFHTKAVTTASIVNVSIGNATFVSSGLLDENSDQGINNALRISLSNIPSPTSGNSYYAWLLSDIGINPATAVALGKLTVDHGNVRFLYPGDQQHTNLLGNTSRFLITEESATHTPSLPSPDKRRWHYYAELPQTPEDIEQHGKAINTLRQLLYEDTSLEALRLYGGSNNHLYINTQKVFEWADSARDAQINKNLVTFQQLIVRILAYLDGTSYVHDDVPLNTPLLVDSTLASFPLIELQKNQDYKGYINSIDSNLAALLEEPAVTPSMHQLASQADTALLNNVQAKLEQVRTDAKQLLNVDTAQLASSSTLSIVNDMVTQASNAYSGWIDPATGKLQEGVEQIHNVIQQLATFDVKPYSP